MTGRMTRTVAASTTATIGGRTLPFRIPLIPADAERGTPPPDFRACRILVVEDEGLVALEIETFLAGAGHEVVGTAAEREGALALARAEPPDLAIVDIRLSGGDSGLDLAADLAALGVPVLFVTGNCPRESGRAVAVGCLHKPFDERQLLAAVAVADRLARGGPASVGRLPSGLHLYRA